MSRLIALKRQHSVEELRAYYRASNDTGERRRIQSALTGKLEHVYHAVMLDPLTASRLTLEQIRMMVDELLQAQRPWLPSWRQMASA